MHSRPIKILAITAAIFIAICILRGVLPSPHDERPAPSIRQSVKIAFIGDVMAHTPQISRAHRDSGYDFNDSFRYVAPILKRADIVIANLETTLSDTEPYTGYPRFRSPVAIADALKNAGTDAVVLANNHSLDYGADGVMRTIRHLDERGIAHTGVFADSTDYLANNPLFIDRKGMRIALLNYTYGTNGNSAGDGIIVNRIDTTAMREDIRRAATADCTIAFMHWGEEYSRRENAAQRELAAFLHANGVPVIIGSHPHVVQPCECSDSSVTFYSLGNFISNQRWRYSDGGIIAEVEIVKHIDDLSFSSACTPVWVRLPDYAAIPRGIGDTLKMDAVQRPSYERFMADTDGILVP